MEKNRNFQIHSSCDVTSVNVTSVNFNSKKVHEDKMFGRQDILQFLSGVFKDYKYVKFPPTVLAL